MRFKNPINGHTEERNWTALWALLFGGFYFIANGLFIPLIIWILLAVPLYLAMGLPATVIMLVINVVYAAMAGSMIRASYLRKGWFELSADGAAADADGQKMRKCPFCAEEILAEAIKCKHCKSDLPPLESANTDQEVDGQLLERPEGMSIGEWHEKVMLHYQIKPIGSGYKWNDITYTSFTDLMEAVRASASA